MAEPLIAGDILDRARRLADDAVKPYFTDDVLFYSYITDAEREFASVSRILRELRNYPVDPGEIWIDLNGTNDTADLEVLEFRSASLLDTTGHRYSLRMIGALDITGEVGGDAYVSEVSGSAVSGRPNTLILGKRYNQFQVYPTPNAAFTVEAQLIVYPSAEISSDVDTLSIPAKYHSLIPIGAAVRAVESYSSEDYNAAKLKGLETAWKRALVRGASENAVISRDGGSVKFVNDLWG